MRWFKVAAIAAGILIGFLVVGSVIGAIFHILTQLVLAALVVGAVVVAVKVARSRRQVSGSKAEREVRDRDDEQYSRPLPRADVEPAPSSYPARPSRPSGPSRPAGPAKPAAHDVDDELARLKREMGGLPAGPVDLGQLGHGRLGAVHAHPGLAPRGRGNDA